MIKLKSLLSENIKGKLTVYHGTRAPFKTFNIKNSTQGIIWFTSNKEKIVNGEVGANGKGYIITANVTINNPAGWDEYDKYGLCELKRDRYDGAILPDGNGGFDCFVFSNKQIKILGIEKDDFKPKLLESTEEYRNDWLFRHKATVENNRVLAYHGTPTKNLKSIKTNGFRTNTYFSLRPEYSKLIAATYHDISDDKVTCLKVWLPLDAIDFVMSDIYSTRVIKFEETL